MMLLIFFEVLLGISLGILLIVINIKYTNSQRQKDIDNFNKRFTHDNQ